MNNFALRQELCVTDVAKIITLTKNALVFSEEEIRVSGELAEEYLLKKEKSGYHFLLVENGEELVAYTCFGIIPFTDRRFDLYWIVVNPQYQKQRVGSMLWQSTEEIIIKQGGLRIYAETSDREDYVPIRNFYRRHGFHNVAEFKDFYCVGDGKIVFCKYLEEMTENLCKK